MKRKQEVNKITGPRKLQEETGVVSYSMKINLQTEKVTITFPDTNEKQEFYNFESYLYELSYYYRRRLEAVESIEDKLAICEKFLNTVYMYMTDWRGYAKDKEKFHKEIHLYIEQFEYFKRQYQQNKMVAATDKKEFSFSTDEKVIILSYLDVLDNIKGKTGTQERATELLSKLLDRNVDNLKKAIRYVGGAPKNKDGIKTAKTLTTIMSYAKEMGFTEIEQKAKDDLSKINKK